MIEGATGSTVPRRQLGRYLRDLRHRAPLTIKAAAERLEWSEAKMWRIETGQTSLRSLDVQAMCTVYGAPAEVTEGLMGLAKETKARGWWHAYGDVIPEGFDLYIGLEQATSEIYCYQAELVPGLLQTAAYARAVIRGDHSGRDDAEIERRVQVRLDRQAMLTRVSGPPTLRVVLNEAVLRRPVGGAAVMAAQLDRIVGAAALPNVEIRVVPFAAGLHHGMQTGQFTLLRFPGTGDGRETEPPVVYVDGHTGALYLDKPAEVDRYATAFDRLWAATLDESASAALVARSAEEFRR